MAKMFYTLAEVCEKLGKSQEDIESMVTSGEIQEFRDGDNLVFKVEQIDLLTAQDTDFDGEGLDLDSSSLELGDDFDLEGTGSIGLESSQSAQAATPTELSGQPLHDDSGSVIGLGASASQSALSDDLDLSAAIDAPPDSGDAAASVSAFDGPAFAGDAGDTQLGDALDDDLTLESVGSGSGLLDLTRESDDTSLGAELLEEVFSSDDDVDMPAAASGLFEADRGDGDQAGGMAAAAVAVSAAPSAAPMLAAAQEVDPVWSGASLGLLIGASSCRLGVFAIVAVESMGGVSGIAPIIASDFWIWVGGLAGGTILLGVIGWFVGRKSD